MRAAQRASGRGGGIVPHSDTPMGLQVLTWVAIALALALIADGVVSLLRERPGLQVGRRRTTRWRPLAWSRILIGSFIVLSFVPRALGASDGPSLALSGVALVLLIANIPLVYAAGDRPLPRVSWSPKAPETGTETYLQRYTRRWKRTVLVVAGLILVADLVMLVVQLASGGMDALALSEGLVIIPVSLAIGCLWWGSVLNLLVAIPRRTRPSEPMPAPTT